MVTGKPTHTQAIALFLCGLYTVNAAMIGQTLTTPVVDDVVDSEDTQLAWHTRLWRNFKAISKTFTPIRSSLVLMIGGLVGMRVQSKLDPKDHWFWRLFIESVIVSPLIWVLSWVSRSARI